eukprot:1751216-Pleurochrysis_carterae.AAC.2
MPVGACFFPSDRVVGENEAWRKGVKTDRRKGMLSTALERLSPFHMRYADLYSTEAAQTSNNATT